MTKALMEAISSGSAFGPFGLIYKEKHHVKPGPVPVPVRPVTCVCFMCFRLKLLCVTLNSADDFCVEAAVTKHVDKSNKRTKTISFRVQLRHRSVKRGLTIYFVVEICCF